MRPPELKHYIHGRHAERVPGNYVAGANIAGFVQVANAMLALGVV